MADPGYIRSLINGLADEAGRRGLVLAFEEVLGNFTIGPVEDGKRAVNGQTYFFTATTSSVANTEFSIHHGQGQSPLWVRPILPCDAVNAQTVLLTTTRAADEQRVYLSSPSTSAAIYVEVGF